MNLAKDRIPKTKKTIYHDSMLKRKITGLALIALSTFLIWQTLSSGSITFTDEDDPSIQETITPEENPNLFTTLILCIGSIGFLGAFLVATKEPLEKELDFAVEDDRFHWKSKSFASDAATAIGLSYFSLLYAVATLICIYFSDFSTARTNATMASILVAILALRLLFFASSTPKEITINKTELIIKKWIHGSKNITHSQIEKTSVSNGRISIWFNDTEQIAFSSEILPEKAPQAIQRILSKAS